MALAKSYRADHWIDGTFIDKGALADSVAPSNGSHVGRVVTGGRAEALAAVEAAKRAFYKGDWSQNMRLRAHVMLEAANRIEARKDELALLLAIETGKTIKAARFEVFATVSELRYYAGLVRGLTGRMIEIEPGTYSLLSREPAGVAGIIVPWNAPGILLIRSLAPALAAGCTTVIKPALASSLFNDLIMRCLAETPGLPKGVINSFNEAGSEGGEVLTTSPDVDVLSFTGSSAIGKKIMAAAAGTLKRLNLELGGKASAIVLEDADLETTAKGLAAGNMIQAGQQCTAINRVLVHESRYDALLPLLASALQAMKLGPVEDEATEVGPLINKPSRDRVKAVVDEAVGMGKARMVGGIPGGELAAGAYLEPSLLAVEDVNSSFVQEEFFGPVLNIERFSTDQEAVEKANATRYGLAGSVWTKDMARAHRIARAMRSGSVWINDHNRLGAEVETGGFRESGFGRLHGVEGLGEFLSTKHIWQAHGRL
ncbi:MAG TPA: aldehyde dehydrogenase family protein [Stellaceae bacterium]|jgi:acyl-CoA reductase-like NAD-dependent aldehyde dehydrogenase|nr:aldehyde dehydrogenase family protein [Stellaceae bacterium]